MIRQVQDIEAPITSVAKIAPIGKFLEPGLYPGVSMDDYLAMPAVSASLCHTLLTHSAHHAWHDSWLNPHVPEKSNKAASIGTVAHAALLEGNLDFVAIIDRNDHIGPRNGVPVGWTNDSIKAARDAAIAKGLTPILKDSMPAIESMVSAAWEYLLKSEIKDIWKAGGDVENTITWLDEGRTQCRIRPDWINKDRSLMLHYKTTQASAQPDAFIRGLLISMGYDITAQFYERGFLHAGFPDIKSVFFVQEQKPPFGCSLVGLAPAMKAMADMKVNQAIAEWTACAKAKYWPSYPTRICWAEPRPWQMAEAEEREADTLLNDDELSQGIPL